MNGHIECRANTIHNCVFDQFPHNSTAHLEYLSCALQHVDNTIHVEEKVNIFHSIVNRFSIY